MQKIIMICKFIYFTFIRYAYNFDGVIKYKVPTLTYKIPGVIDVIKDSINGCTVNPGEINQIIKNL